MPRRREVPKRDILPDPKFGSVDLSKFMNVIMESGKKAIAERIIYGALEQVEKKSGKDPLEIFVTALNNIKPMVEVKSRRVGGANYQVPVEVRPVRRVALAMRWLKESARKLSKDIQDRVAAFRTFFDNGAWKSVLVQMQKVGEQFDAELRQALGGKLGQRFFGGR